MPETRIEITPETLIREIGLLDRKRTYPYVNPSNRGRIKIMDVCHPSGPISVQRIFPSKDGRRQKPVRVSVPANSLTAIAAALSTGRPVNVDSALYNSGNSRSVLEALLAHTPSVFVTFPDIVTGKEGKASVRRKVKHLIWTAGREHPPGTIDHIESNVVIAETSAGGTIHHPVLSFPAEVGSSMVLPPDHELTRHAQMQYSLMLLGAKLGNPVWIARNDHGISDSLGRFGDRPGVLKEREVRDLALMRDKETMDAFAYVDCAWLSRDRNGIEAAFEIEHSTGITSGLTRLLRLWFSLPVGARHETRWMIVARDALRDKVVQISSREQFRPLDAWFLPYSGVDELRFHCERRGLRGATSEFIENFAIRTREG